MYIIILAFRNFLRNRSRYRVLIVTMTIAVAAMVILFSVFMGINRSVESKATRYFSGAITIQEFSHNTAHSKITNVDSLIKYISTELKGVAGYSCRTVYSNENASIFFNGYYSKLRKMIGVDWNLEAGFLDKLNLVDGFVPVESDPEGIVLSTSTIKNLGCRVGDSIIISLKTAGGQINTANLIVRAVFDESSFFGYAAYLERSTLNSILQYPEDEVNEIGLFLEKPSVENSVVKKLRFFFLKSDQDVYTPANRQQRDSIRVKLVNPAVLILDLNAQLAEVKDLLDAVSIVSILVIILFLAILIVGVSNTYSMLVYERTKEIGTMRAIGLQKNPTVFLFLVEAVYIAIVSFCFGLISGLFILILLSRSLLFSVSGFSALFLESGRLPWYLTFGWILIIFSVTVFSILIGVLRPALSASRMAPVDAMQQE